MIGWVAATGHIGIEAVLMFALIFMWTPPHFWALALFKAGDYGRAGIPMMPNVAGELSTRRQMFFYALILAPLAVLPAVLGYVSWGYGIAAAALGAGFVWKTWAVLAMSSDDKVMKPAKQLFAYSIVYLFAIFAIYLVDVVVWRLMASIGA